MFTTRPSSCARGRFCRTSTSTPGTASTAARPGSPTRDLAAGRCDTDLLWVYEGLTRYLGDFLLTTRSGIRTVEKTRDYIAWVAANRTATVPAGAGGRWPTRRSSAQILSGLPDAVDRLPPRPRLL